MNWVGGARKRVKLQDDTHKQKVSYIEVISMISVIQEITNA